MVKVLRAFSGVSGALMCMITAAHAHQAVNVPTMLSDAVKPMLVAQVIPVNAGDGENITVRVRAQPHAHLKIEVQDLSFTQVLNLLDKDADAQGNAEWTFRVGREYKAKLLPIIISEQLAGFSEKLVLNVTLAAQPVAKPFAIPLSFVELPHAARAGQRVSVTVHTLPGAKVRIEAQGAGFPQASSLMDRTANKAGLVTWTWQLRDNYEANIMPIIVTADYHRAENKVAGAIHVFPGAIQPAYVQRLAR